MIFDDLDEQRAYKALKTACTRNRASDAHRQLFLWAKARFPHINSTNQLGNQHDDLAIELDNLEMHLFSSAENTTWRGAALLAAVDSLRSRKAGRIENRALSASLNPT